MRFSIITVCWNAETTIEETIKSVLHQTYKDIEYIVIDGASTDNTCNIINRYRDNITHYISEPDSGIYNAMNKGVKVATGDILYFLNANDRLYDAEILTGIAQQFNLSKTDMLYGNIEAIDDTGLKQQQIYGQIDRMYFYKTCFVQQAIFYRASCFRTVGLFDEAYRISGDYEWIVRAVILHRLNMEYINALVCSFSLGGISNNLKNIAQHKEENEKIRLHFRKKDIYIANKVNVKRFRRKHPLLRNMAVRLMGWHMP